MMRDGLLLALVTANAYFLVASIANAIFLRRATRPARLTSGPFVSVIVPARNEESVIERCLTSLLTQDYADYEVLVVDDQSTDATAAIVRRLAAADPRLHVVSGEPLPDGWLGKPHALAEGAAAARGEILVLTDADTIHSPKSVSWAVTNLTDHGADILSGYLDQRYGSFGERLIVPTMYAAMLLLPLPLVPRRRNLGTAFAIGQYVAVRRSALDAVGGYESIRGSITDDMSMAKRLNARGYRGIFLDAREAAGCRLYTGYRDAFRGIERSIYSALGGNPVASSLVTAIVLAVIVAPAVSVLLGAVRLQLQPGPVALAFVLFAAAWALVCWDRDVPFTAFALYPLVFANLMLILNGSMLATGFGGGADWKGRPIRAGRSSGADETLCDEPGHTGEGRCDGRL